MTKRYITIPPPVKLFDPGTDAPILLSDGQQAEAEFAVAMRKVVSNMMAAKPLPIDMMDLIELRVVLARGKVGEEVGIEDTWWEALVEAFRRPEGLTAFYVAASGPHIMAVKEARTEPRQLTNT